MTKLRVHCFSISLDGYGAGPDQGLENPLGAGGEEMHEWIFQTRGGREMIGETGGSEGVDNDFFDAGFIGIGATIMGRNMFGPVRGDWPDDEWKGWWGSNPVYHHPVFVLTHHARDPITMEGGTTFNFVTDGIESALEQAREAAGGKDVALAGGANIAQQYLKAGLIDEMQIHVVPILLGDGARLLDNLGGAEIELECTRVVEAPGVTHLTYRTA